MKVVYCRYIIEMSSLASAEDGNWPVGRSTTTFVITIPTPTTTATILPNREVW